jgi:rare lipoprotein A
MNKTLVSSALITATLMTGLMTGTDSQAAAQSGKASYYHDRFHGHRTASGAAYNKNALSAAHKTLPLGTQVLVTDTRSGRSVVVRINDRGPYARGRVIDLSRAAAREIGLVNKGVASVRLDVLDGPERRGI